MLLSAGKQSTTFTQDGLEVGDLREELSDKADKSCLQPKETPVGWACINCRNVFQGEALLQNHQNTICIGVHQYLTLVQIHYACVACGVHYGSQASVQLDFPREFLSP